MKEFLNSIARAGRDLIGLASALSDVEALTEACHELLKQRGEATAIALGAEVLAGYMALDESERTAFFEALLNDLQPDPSAIAAAVADWKAEPSPNTVMRLGQAVNAPRKDLLRALNMAPGGTEALIRMREDLLDRLPNAPYLLPVDSDFAYLFRSWFNRGFLTLRRIDWETPAFVLEKLISYEAVHEITGWSDLRRRLAEDRRCFGFFHPALPDEPLIFVQVALVKGLTDSIDALIGAPEPGETLLPDSAIFYSISNCQRGLRGVNFGNFLIKQVAEELGAELPSLKRFATLSPIPGFRSWLDEANAVGESLPLSATEFSRLQHLSNPLWYQDEDAAKALKPVMRKLCAHYLLKVKSGREPRDPVARFHLRNGARLERINWLADISAKGLRDSVSMMVNYVYEHKGAFNCSE